MLRDRFLLGRRCRTFTLQWHLTNACGQSCRHCYDRSERPPLPEADARRVLLDLRHFCARHGLSGHVCLTGGDPFLYPHLLPLYRAIAESGLSISILGNPVSREALAEIAAIRKPQYFQVSLEGRRETNDRIRGAGHYDRTVEFLDGLRAMGIPSHVMLTLTRDNLEEVLPLAEALRGRADRFAFNRLARVGNAADLEVPARAEFVALLQAYLRASAHNRSLHFKDSLFNLVRSPEHRRPFGGCTGHGCGAAFNFVALLPEGEVHACRKFPSPIGDLRNGDLEAAYSSSAARRFRTGCRACRVCRLPRWCGGCLAFTYGLGLDPLECRDPLCFRDGIEWDPRTVRDSAPDEQPDRNQQAHCHDEDP